MSRECSPPRGGKGSPGQGHRKGDTRVLGRPPLPPRDTQGPLGLFLVEAHLFVG